VASLIDIAPGKTLTIPGLPEAQVCQAIGDIALPLFQLKVRRNKLLRLQTNQFLKMKKMVLTHDIGKE